MCQVISRMMWTIVDREYHFGVLRAMIPSYQRRLLLFIFVINLDPEPVILPCHVSQRYA